MRRGLVLAGGGLAGIAWELGVLLGLRDVDPVLADDVLGADVVVGTSAGSTVAAQITSGVDLADLFAAQLTQDSAELAVDVDLPALAGHFAEATGSASTPAEARQRIGAWALAVATVDESVRRAVVAQRLPVHRWPERRLLIPAVDATSGELIAFSSDSGVDLVDAVAASCAVPGVWPPVSIGGRRYVDGGVRSGTNADLATGCDQVVVLTPTLAGAPSLAGDLGAEIEALRPADVTVVHADEASVAAFGVNPLSPTSRRPSALAGRTLGREQAPRLAAAWR